MAEAEATQIPVQPFQVQQTLRHLAMPRLLHPRDAVDAFNQAARTPYSTQYLANPSSLFLPIRLRLGQLDRAGQRPRPCGGRSRRGRREAPRLAIQSLQIEQGRQDLAAQAQLGQAPVRLIQEREALSAEQQSTGLSPCRSVQVRQGRRHNRLGLLPLVETAFRREKLEGGSAQLPRRLGGHRLIPKLLSLTPQAVRRFSMARLRYSLTVHSVQLLLCLLGALQGSGGRPPGFPQRTAPFAERVKDVQHVLEIIGEAFGATKASPMISRTCWTSFTRSAKGAVRCGKPGGRPPEPWSAPGGTKEVGPNGPS